MDASTAYLVQHNFRSEMPSFKYAADKLQMLNEPLPSFHDYFGILQKVKKDEDFIYVKLVHKHIHAVGLEAHETIGSYLVRLLVNCGSVDHARRVFNKLTNRSEYCWTALIQGYTEAKEYVHALELFKDMQENHIDPTTYTVEVLLKACASLQCIDSSLEIHFQIVKEEFEKDFFIGSSLVDLYVKCGLLEEAQVVFNELEDHDVIVWNFLIAGYLSQGSDIKALDFFDKMQSEGVPPDAITYLCALKACCNLGAFERAQSMHADIVKEGFESSLEVGNTLVDMYAKFGSFEEALEVVEEMTVQDVVTWSALITGYAEHGLGEQALSCLQQMQSKGVHPNSITLSSSLKACSSIEASNRGLELHAQIITEEYESDPFVCSNLLDFYSKCGMFAEAWEIFDSFKTQDTVSSNALVSGFVKHGLYEEVLDCFDHLHVKGIHPDSVTFVCCLKACGSIPTLKRGQEIHSEILKKGLEADSFVGNSLVDMYARCSSLSDSQETFVKLLTRDIVSWNTLIAGYVDGEFHEEALECFQQMQVEAISPNSITYLVILKACGSIGAIEIGRGIHSEIAKKSLQSNPFVANALVNFYADSGNLGEALQVFDELTDVDPGSWSSIVKRYLESGWREEAFNNLEQMQLEGISVGLVTALCRLKVCIDCRSIDRGRPLHMNIVKEGLERDSVVAYLVLDMYAKCGSLQDAQKVFDEFLPIWSALEWNIIITGYVELGKSEEAFTLFVRMQEQGLLPLTMTFSSLLKSCVNNSALEAGKRLHAQRLRPSSHGPAQELIATTLIDMYGKFGSRTYAENVFQLMFKKDLISWSAFIGVYVCQGETELVFSTFNRMRAESVKPDAILFVSILTACSHAGFALKGQEYFETMSKDYGITPIIEHYNCMIDLLGRAGQLGEAVALLENMPFEPDFVTWSSVLGACRNWGHKDLGGHVLDLVKFNVKYEVMCTLMWNTYADFYSSEEIEKMRNLNMLEKELGISQEGSSV